MGYLPSYVFVRPSFSAPTSCLSCVLRALYFPVFRACFFLSSLVFFPTVLRFVRPVLFFSFLHFLPTCLSFYWHGYLHFFFFSLTRTLSQFSQIEWLQTTAYLKVYLLNGRFKDLMFFLWEYRHAGWEVLKKMIRGNQSALKASSKPADYDGVLSSGERTSKDSFISARQDWNQTQVRELKRAKLKSPHLAKSINSKKSA